MASFHRNHSYFQHSFTGLQSRDKLDFVISSTSSSCASPIPDRIRCFSSQLAISSIDSGYLSPSFCTASDDTSSVDSSSNRPNSHKRSRATPNLKKRHMMTRSRTGKGRLLRLFNNSSPTLCDNEDEMMDDDGVYFARNKDDTMDEVMLGDGSDTSIANEFYTVSSPYTSPSLLLDHDGQSPATEIYYSETSEARQQSQNNTIDPAVEAESKDQTDEVSHIPSPVSLVLQKNTEDSVTHHELRHEKEQDSDTEMTYYEAPVMLVCARSWKYPPSSHVYASKILSEMKVIMHEYCIWLEKTQEARSKSSMIFVPRLSLDWPKNWTFSHS